MSCLGRLSLSRMDFLLFQRWLHMKKKFAPLAIVAMALVTITFSGCRLDENSNPSIKLGKYENTIIACTDGLDNDGNGYVDCDDWGDATTEELRSRCLQTSDNGSTLNCGCHTQGTTLNPGPGATVCPAKENNNYVCSDGKDNDGNGFIDCEDNSCRGTSVCCTSKGTEDTLEACSDGIDNDCNGYIDCGDYSCSRSKNPEIVKYCQAINCPAGISDEITLEECSDGIDNNCNGYVDCQDNSCKNSTNPIVHEYCRLKLDPNAVPNPEIDVISPNAVAETTPELCSDGRDNDFNGHADCADVNCQKLNLDYCKNATQEPPARPDNFDSLSLTERCLQYQNEKEICTDRKDNDLDGLVDCAEYSCLIRSLEVIPSECTNAVFSCQPQDDSNTKD